MGTEERTPPAAVSYLSLLYDLCLVRDRLAWIISDLDTTIGIPEIISEDLQRVNAFLGKKLAERGFTNGTIQSPEVVSSELPPPEASMGS